jgi:hypothetical protein
MADLDFHARTFRTRKKDDLEFFPNKHEARDIPMGRRVGQDTEETPKERAAFTTLLVKISLTRDLRYYTQPPRLQKQPGPTWSQLVVLRQGKPEQTLPSQPLTSSNLAAEWGTHLKATQEAPRCTQSS